jgi:DNA-binding transcriptional ArsR family regulator
MESKLRMTTLRDERLDGVFAALASSTRRAILARLAEGEATVTELAEPFDLSLPAVSKHLKVLEEARLIQRGRRAQFRPCVLDPRALDGAMSWAAACRDTWNARLDRLEAHLARTMEEDKR